MFYDKFIFFRYLIISLNKFFNVKFDMKVKNENLCGSLGSINLSVPCIFNLFLFKTVYKRRNADTRQPKVQEKYFSLMSLQFLQKQSDM